MPNKNLRLLGGKPLIAHAIHAALETRHLDRVVVSTDSPKIADVAAKYGADVPFLRPAELATDEVPERLAWRHAIEQVEAQDRQAIDVFVSIPPTCPLRAASDIERTIDSLLAGNTDIVLTATPSRCNPYFNMVTIDSDGTTQLASQPDGHITRRQDAPAVYELTAVAYAARRDSIFQYDSIFDSHASAIEVPEERAIDIDTEFDLRLAEFLLSDRTESHFRNAA